MSERKISQHFENLTEDAKKYIESEIAYYKLDVYKKSIKISTTVLWIIIIASLALLAYTFLCIGLALLIGKWLDNYYLGFFIISGLFLVLFTAAFVWAKPFIEHRTIMFFNKTFND